MHGSDLGRLSSILRQDADAIVAAWLHRVGERGVTRPVAKDDVPNLVEKIASIAAAEAAGQPAPSTEPESRAHALSRLEHRFDLSQLIVEYGVLRDVLVEHCDRRGITARAMSPLHSTLDESLHVAAVVYAREQHRALQALERMSHAGLVARDIGELLETLISILQDLSSAFEVVVVFLRQGSQLELRASGGVLESHRIASIPVGEGFAGGVAATGEPALLHRDDAPATSESRLEALSDVRVAYGIPMIQKVGVFGVVVVGSRARSELADYELRLARAVVERAATAAAQALSTARERAARAVSRALESVATSEELTQKLLPAIGESFGWDVGAHYWVTEAGALQCEHVWSAPGVDSAEFLAITREARFGRGDGLPGRAWEAASSAWIWEVARDPDFPRAAAAAATGLRSAIAVPIWSEERIVGVVELFSCRLRSPADEGVLLAEVLSTQVSESLRRIAAQQHASQEHATTAAILETALDAIISMDRDGRVTAWNPAAERTFGYSADETLGEDMADLIIPPRLREAHRRGLARYLATGRERYLNRRIELHGHHRDGHEFPVELTITRVPSPGPPQFTGYLRDISDRRAIERERERLLDESRLAVKLRDDVLATVSHDLRSPLGTIKLATAWLFARVANDTNAPARRQLDIIQRSCERMERLIRDLLDMASIRAGRFSVARTAESARQLIQAAVENEHAFASEHDVSVTCDLALDDERISCDRERLFQVFSNLMGNAIKVCPPGAMITIRARPHEDVLRIDIEDSGPGIPASEQARLFDPYFSAERGGRRSTGLGLFISRGIIEAHGGEIWAESTEGAGATISFTVPFATALDVAPQLH